MTKEELKQEAEEWLCNNLHSASEEDFIKAMVDIAEPRERQITGLSKHILELQKDKGNLIDRCRELEAQIEKMKCCYNCSKWNDGECEESPKSKTFFCADFKCDNWEMFK